jgi:alpha-tubulin suppressor-like RCC1 family protein
MGFSGGGVAGGDTGVPNQGGSSMGGEPRSGGVPTDGGESGSGGVSTGGGAAGNDGTSSEGGVPSEGGAAGGGGANEPSLSAISVNLYDSCALFSDASVKCWGTAEAYGTSDQPFHFGYSAPLAAEKPLKIVEMPGVTVEHVATSLFSTCVLLSDRSVKCWGSNLSGQLGRGNKQPVTKPVSIDSVSITTAPGDHVEQIVVGEMHACALLSSNAVRCWGNNDFAQLGQGNLDWIGDDELPSDAPALSVVTETGVRIKSLAAGPLDTCALLSNGHMKCWGKSDFGELGDGEAGSYLVGDDELPSSRDDIVLTNGPETVKQLVIGYHHMCMLLSDASVRCWGRSDILGYGANAPQLPQRARYAPPVSIAPPGQFVTELSAGWFHTCALTSDGSVRCWGIGVYGQLGLGSTDSVGDDELPSDVPPIQLTNLPGVEAVALSSGQGDHTCALLSDGSAKCWGYNAGGQLGDVKIGNIGDDETPASTGPVPF